jgi:hypothetical protein
MVGIGELMELCKSFTEIAESQNDNQLLFGTQNI